MERVAQRQESGVALLTALLVIAVLMLLGGAFLTVGITESAIAANQVAAARAFHAAEAGIAHARLELADEDVDELLENGGVLFNDRDLGLGSYTVTVSNNVAPSFPRGPVPADGGGATENDDAYLVVTSSGSYRNASRTVEVVVQENAVPAAQWGLFGDYFISAHGSGTINGDIGTNGNIVLSTSVIGDAFAGGTVNNPGLVSGTVTTGVPMVRYRSARCPSAYGPAPLGPGVDFDSHSGLLTIDGSSDTLFPGGEYYFEGFLKSGSGQMVVPPGEVVQIYIGSGLRITGGGFENASHAPANLQLLGCGPNPAMQAAAPEWRLTADNPMWLVIYAPIHPLRLLGGSNLTGSIIGMSIFKSGAGNVIYDPAVAEAAASSYTVVRGTWTEVLH
jgi:hypothetical protein